MEIRDLAAQYQTQSDEELLQLALDPQQLTPEANALLRAELAKRHIHTDDRFNEFRVEKQQHEEQDRSSKRASLFPTITRATKTIRDWRQYRRRAGTWPILSIAGHVLHFAALLGVIAFMVWYGVGHNWSKPTLLLVSLPVILVEGVLWDSFRKGIRLRELVSYRNRRNSTLRQR